jgi:hypothetical protein
MPDFRAQLDALQWRDYAGYIPESDRMGVAIGTAVARAIEDTFGDALATSDPIAVAIAAIQHAANDLIDR